MSRFRYFMVPRSLLKSAGLALILGLGGSACVRRVETTVRSPERLNNFVVELADVKLARTALPARMAFTMDREGWLYLRLDGEGDCVVSLDADGTALPVLEAPGEAMRFIPAGEFHLGIDPGSHARPERLILRRVAEILAYNIEFYEPPMPTVNLRHNWEEWSEAVLHSAQVVVSRPHPVYAPYAERWQQQGRRWLRRQSIRPFWEESAAPADLFAEMLGGQPWNGLILDELLPEDFGRYARYGAGLERFSRTAAGRDKTVYWWIWSLDGRSANARRVLEFQAPDITEVFRVSDESAVTGRHALQVVSMATADGRPRTHQPRVSLEPGEEYVLSAFMRTEGNVNGDRSGLWLIDRGWENEYGRLQPVEGDSDWNRVEASFVAENSRDGFFQLMIARPTEGRLWIDAVQLERGGVATDFADDADNLLRNPDFEAGLAHWMEGAGDSRPLLDAVIAHGHAFSQEMYLLSEPTREQAEATIDHCLSILAGAFRVHPGPLERHVLIAPLLSDIRPGAYCGNFHPNVNYKVFLEMQVRAMATREGLQDLRGIGMWTAAYTSPEVLRWYGALLRHYGIEGRTDWLGSDPYILEHIENGGFHEDLSGWTVTGSSAPRQQTAISRSPTSTPARFSGTSCKSNRITNREGTVAG